MVLAPKMENTLSVVGESGTTYEVISAPPTIPIRSPVVAVIAATNVLKS